jgi:trk system potassium uptake protein
MAMRLDLAFFPRLMRHLEIAVRGRNPVRIVVIGYAIYMLAGWALLSSPAAQQKPVHWLDNLFISVSAVSTTGLVTIDPGTSYTFFGQVVILLLIQAGGLGYMTIGSLAVIALGRRLSPERQRVGRAAFGLPDDFRIEAFVRKVLAYTILIQGIGALTLWAAFTEAGVQNPLWHAIFHSVSAFCTAGFSLNADSFMSHQRNTAVLWILSALSIAGAIGFLVLSDIVRRIFIDGRPLLLTSVLVLPVTGLVLFFGTFGFLFLEPQITTLPGDVQLANAFFQAMTAATTVGFNSIDTASYAPIAMALTYIVMVVGASPAGTGGGLKTTTVGVMSAATLAVIRGSHHVRIGSSVVPVHRVVQSLALGFTWVSLIALAMLALTLTESLRFEHLLFEAISALAAVGLSMGITGSLSPAGKLIIIALMFLGRIGVLSIFVGIAVREREGQHQRAKEEDVVL